MKHLAWIPLLIFLTGCNLPAVPTATPTGTSEPTPIPTNTLTPSTTPSTTPSATTTQVPTPDNTPTRVVDGEFPLEAVPSSHFARVDCREVNCPVYDTAQLQNVKYQIRNLTLVFVNLVYEVDGIGESGIISCHVAEGYDAPLSGWMLCDHLRQTAGPNS